ncbi:MAG: hypothetical protein OXU63_08650 [Acidobacteriota bacterium]|nr:hypothetical protein [Acidobacteriota bacterium]
MNASLRLVFDRFFTPPAASSYFLFGPRGTGKSTWLADRYPGALSIDLNDPARAAFTRLKSRGRASSTPAT